MTGAQPSFAAAIASTPEPVPQSASGPPRLAGLLQLDQQPQAEAGGRVGAGAERPAGIDHDVDQPLARLPPGRAEPSRPETTIGRWKSVHRSAQSSGTAVAVTSTRPPPGGRLQLAEVGHLSVAAVDRELDPARAPLLLEPVRRQLGSFAITASAYSGRQRTASRIIRAPARRGEKKLPSPSPVERRLRGSERLVERSAASRCSSSRSVGTTTSKTTCWSPRRPPRRGQAAAAQRNLAVLGPRGDLDLELAVEVSGR